ncbi:hypothetical protein LP419_32210 [Massilia sp. H-1]|nr:hypothetical protein LP419_32210 [Massilia sp. H-1]
MVAGVDGAYMPGGTVFSEYRLRDSADTGFDAQHNAQLASGLRNSFQLRPGVSAATGIEYLKVLDGAAQEAVAVSGAIDYRVDPLWSASAKLEYRKLFDRADLLADQSQDQWLSTLTLARKLSEDWTLLARNYLLYQRNRDDLQGAALGNTVQDRAQLGFAWRPRERNDVNALARYEYKTVRDQARAEGEDYRAHIVSVHADYHPSRAWWMSGRLAKQGQYRPPPAMGRTEVHGLAGRWPRGMGYRPEMGRGGARIGPVQPAGRQPPACLRRRSGLPAGEEPVCLARPQLVRL